MASYRLVSFLQMSKDVHEHVDSVQNMTVLVVAESHHTMYLIEYGRDICGIMLGLVTTLRGH